MKTTDSMMRRLGTLLAISLMVAPGPSVAADELSSFSDLGRDLAANVRALDLGTVAVAEFSALDGSRSDLGKLISEEITTSLWAAGGLRVVERSRLDKVLVEQSFQLGDLVEPSTAQTVGSLLGVDALVLGTYADTGSNVRINARIVSVASGEVASATALTVPRTQEMATLLSNRTAGVSTSLSPPPGAIWSLDLSGYGAGDAVPELGENLYSLPTPGGLALGAPTGTPGNPSVELGLQLPDEFVVEMDLLRPGGVRWAVAPLKLLTADGQSYEVEYKSICMYDGGHLAEVRLNGAEGTKGGAGKEACSGDTPVRIRITVKGKTVKVHLNDEYLVSGARPTASRVERLRLTLDHDVYKLTDLTIRAL